MTSSERIHKTRNATIAGQHEDEESPFNAPSHAAPELLPLMGVVAVVVVESGMKVVVGIMEAVGH